MTSCASHFVDVWLGMQMHYMLTGFTARGTIKIDVFEVRLFLHGNRALMKSPPLDRDGG